MRRREFITLLGVTAAARPNLAAAIAGGRALVAMLISGSSDGYVPFVAAFRRGLQRFGYVEGYDLEIVYRYSDGDPMTALGSWADNVRASRWGTKQCVLETFKARRNGGPFLHRLTTRSDMIAPLRSPCTEVLCTNSTSARLYFLNVL